MISNWPILTIITFLPMIGVTFLMMIRGEEAVSYTHLTLPTKSGV